ncbi:MAG: prolyl oligopeptidase family serine peptidase, partial [Afipia sp.]|nr:prolyl oligopeptidase family serine peptidase [Afipia sp.]
MLTLLSGLTRLIRRLSFTLAALFLQPAIAESLPVEDLVGLDKFEDIRLSPTGEYLALTVPLADRTALAMVRLSDGQQLGSIQHGRDIHIEDFEWVGPDRIVYSIGERFGQLKTPQSTGELFAIDVDGNGRASLIGFRAGKGASNFTRVKQTKSESVSARIIKALPDQPQFALISVQQFSGRRLPFSRVERIDVRSGNRVLVATAPVANARFLADHANRVRFAWGSDTDNVQHVYQRDHDEAEWRLLNDESVSGRRMFPLAFSSDDRTAYVQVEETSGPDGLYTVVDGELAGQPVARDDDTDVHRLLRSPFDGSPFAVVFLDGLPRIEYLQPEGELARLHRSLQASFPGQSVLLGQASSDGRLGLIVTHSDRNPGDVYLFEFASKKASFVMARNQRIDPERMAAMRPFRFTARDGTPLNGYLTLPPGGPEKNLPLVVHPHGGPIGERDEWRFDATVQWLAANGYAVLQVNFRGSGGYGRAFLLAGYRQWGRA